MNVTPQPASPILDAERRQDNPGIAVLSSTRKLLYTNEAAHSLLIRMNGRENKQATGSIVPRSVDKLLDEISTVLDTAGRHHRVMQLHARRLLTAEDRTLLVKAFGIPDIRQSLIVLTIQEEAQSS